MSTADRSPTIAPGWTWRETTTPSGRAQEALAWLAGVVRWAIGELRTNRPLRLSVLSFFGAWVVLEVAFVAWVHYSLEGAADRAFLPGLVFGVPEREAAAGTACTSTFGYDGQFYYWQSNDVFGRHDAHSASRLGVVSLSAHRRPDAGRRVGESARI